MRLVFLSAFDRSVRARGPIVYNNKFGFTVGSAWKSIQRESSVRKSIKLESDADWASRLLFKSQTRGLWRLNHSL